MMTPTTSQPGFLNDAIVQHKPFVYQEIAGTKYKVESNYKLYPNNQIGFELGYYDAAKPLVIDPTLGYAVTFGTADDTTGNAIATDKVGNAYITGIAYSAQSPFIGKPGKGNIFVTKLNAAGELIYNTYIGGSGEGVGLGIAVDADRSAYVTGQLDSSDFPVTNAAFQPQFRGTTDAFVLKLNPAGNALVYSSFLGGTGDDIGTSIALDRAENAYVAGETTSKNFPAIDPIYPFGEGPTDAFVCKVNANGSRLLYSTALTGPSSNPDGGSAAWGIAVNRRGAAVVAGFTTSEKFPTVHPLQAKLNGPLDAFVSRINQNGNKLDFSTYLGGSNEDAAFGVALDPAENVYLTGLTNSTDFPQVNAFLPGNAGGDDAFVTKLIPNGNAVVYSTYLGGGADDVGWGIAVNDAGAAHIAGRTRSKDFPLEDPLSATSSIPGDSLKGDVDAFFTKFSINGKSLVYSTYLGGSGEDRGFGAAVWQNRNAYTTGFTTSIGWIRNNLAPPKLPNTSLVLLRFGL